MKRHFTSMALIALSLLLVLSACGTGTTTGQSSAPSSAASTAASASSTAPAASQTEAASGGFQSDPRLNAPGELPIVNEPVTIKIIYSATKDLKENYAATYIEDKTGVTIDWLLSPVDQYKEKLNLMLASSEKADLIIPPNNTAARITKIEEFKYASQGMLVPINDFIEHSSKFVKELYATNPDYYTTATTPDGNIYSFQRISEPGRGTYHGTASYKMWMNRTWLDNLGLSVPTTTEEFYEVLKAFKEQDANGNGDPNDEIPLSTCTKGANVSIDGFLMNAFTYNNPNPNSTTPYLRITDDGKVEASVTVEDYREGLRYLNRLYNEGLLYPDAFTQDRATQTALNESADVARIGALPAQHCGYLVASLTESDRWLEYEALTPLKGPNGVQLTPTPHANEESWPSGMIPVTSDQPEIAFRFIDAIYEDQFTKVINYGQEGVSWRKAESGEMSLDGSPADITSIALDTSTTEANLTLTGFPTIAIVPTKTSYNLDPKAPNGAGHEVVLYRATEKMEPYKVNAKYIVPNVYYETDENERISSYKATINPYIEECIARFITGDMNIENDWDGYLKELDSMGLSDYLSIVQNGYDRYIDSTSK
ncbi:extracellular solute-binding protein [Ruminococcaceae bacterium OttesenSCG-928-L11]|nr:extracellular solute-binding protein [Ruminococcaceae bacterium OttesenSCG-928-L11]